jgi:integrase
MSGNAINTTRKQHALIPRKEPYWHAFRRGASVGLYVGATKREWCARAKDPAGAYRYSTLGTLDALTYEQAEAKARAFADLTARNERPNYTVADAIDDYVKDAKVRNSESSAKGIRQRLTRNVPPELASRRLSDLRSIEVKRWRDGMVRESTDPEAVRRSKDNANRVFAMLKAALNLAFKSGYAASDGEWRRVTTFQDVGEPRRLFLTPEQVRALLDTTEGAFRDLLKAAVLTGARYGELIAAKARDFDRKSGTLHLSGKTGPRACYPGQSHHVFLIFEPLEAVFCGEIFGTSKSSVAR